MPAKKGWKPLDLSGQKFGRYTVTDKWRVQKTYTQWFCVCDCGNERWVIGRNLRIGQSKSCGCLHRELSSGIGKIVNLTHGMTHSPEYQSWKAMKQRTRNPNWRYYQRYGGRGIAMCERWNSFENFYADMGPKPSCQHTLDRINNDGNYEPSNCRWATWKEQAQNRSKAA